MKKFSILFITVLIVSIFFMQGCLNNVKPKQDILYSICKANNLFKIYDCNRLSFTFNVQLPDKSVHRHWEWHIKTNQIFLNGVKSDISQAFVNDIYWLMFPLKAYEDRNQTIVSEIENQKSPLTNMDTTEVIVRYVSGKGYTPNDTYKLYVDKTMTIREWSYLKASKEPPARTTAWQDYRKIDDMMLSLSRPGPDGFKVWFTHVEIE